LAYPAHGLQNRSKSLGFHGLPQNRSGSVLKTDQFSVKTEASYCSITVYPPVLAGFENRLVPGFVIRDPALILGPLCG
jgi:hypothetical protein